MKDWCLQNPMFVVIILCVAIQAVCRIIETICNNEGDE